MSYAYAGRAHCRSHGTGVRGATEGEFVIRDGLSRFLVLLLADLQAHGVTDSTGALGGTSDKACAVRAWRPIAYARLSHFAAETKRALLASSADEQQYVGFDAATVPIGSVPVHVDRRA